MLDYYLVVHENEGTALVRNRMPGSVEGVGN